MSEINSSNFKKEHGDLAPDLVGVTELTSPYFFVPPSGNSAERPENCEPGTLRFNTDHGTLEVYRGDTIGWEQIQRRDGQYLGGGTGSPPSHLSLAGTRAVILGGTGSSGSSLTDNIDFFTIQTQGNAENFGDLTTSCYSKGVVCDGTRVIAAGGRTPSFVQDIDFFTISSQGDAADSGYDLNNTYNPQGLSDSVRGVYAITSGPAYSNAIDYITIQSLGDAQDFENIIKILKSASGCKVIDERKDGGYITPLEAEGDYTTFISRIRKDNSNVKAINLWVVSDNLLKGAALNTVQIAECLMKKM